VIRNTGTEPATVTVSLITNNNDAVGIFDFCKQNGKPRKLAGGETCLVSAELSGGPFGLNADPVSSGSYVACKVTASNVTNLRGTLELAESPSHGFRRVPGNGLLVMPSHHPACSTTPSHHRSVL